MKKLLILSGRNSKRKIIRFWLAVTATVVCPDYSRAQNKFDPAKAFSSLPIGKVTTKRALGIVTRAMKELRKEYSDAFISCIKDSMSGKEAELKRIITANNSKILPQANTNEKVVIDYALNDILTAHSTESTDTKTTHGGSLFFDFVEFTPDDEPIDDEFSRASISYKQTELVYNRCQIIKYLTDMADQHQTMEWIASDLLINNMSVSQYVADKTKSGVKDKIIVKEVKKQIVMLIDNTLIKPDNK